MVSIGEHGIIGNCRTAALVATNGDIDWFCTPDFGSPSVFASLLDPLAGGVFSLQPTAPFRSRQRYLESSPVLETRFETDGGALVVTDLMPVASEDRKSRSLHPEHEILRIARCERGAVEIEIRYAPRPQTGEVSAHLIDRGPLGIASERRGRLLLLRSDTPFEMSTDRSEARGRRRLGAGEQVTLSLTSCTREPIVLVPLGAAAAERVESTLGWWRDWVGRCKYEGNYPEPVIRSLITLKLLTFAPSGAIVAAPTTSLPEVIGGHRNWDYRLCWIRDAAMSVQAMLHLGYHKEASAFISWLLHTTRRTAPRLQTLYDVFGHPSPSETIIEWLTGYRESRPVRAGNAAHDQLQLDTYGEAIAAVGEYVDQGGELESGSRRLLREFGGLVCDRWKEPDEGIWEIRSGRRHHTYSKLLCWTALDRLLRLHERGALDKIPVDRFRETRELIAETIDKGAVHRDGHYTAVLGGEDVDASLLLMPFYGYIGYEDPVMQKTVEIIERRLSRGPLVFRYLDHDDGVDGDEAAFGVCGFWLAGCLARQGRMDEAVARFEALLEHANPLGLFSEEIDVTSGEARGNFPQAFTHIGLIEAALEIDEARGHGRRARGQAHGERQ